MRRRHSESALESAGAGRRRGAVATPWRRREKRSPGLPARHATKALYSPAPMRRIAAWGVAGQGVAGCGGVDRTSLGGLPVASRAQQCGTKGAPSRLRSTPPPFTCLTSSSRRGTGGSRAVGAAPAPPSNRVPSEAQRLMEGRTAATGARERRSGARTLPDTTVLSGIL